MKFKAILAAGIAVVFTIGLVMMYSSTSTVATGERVAMLINVKKDVKIKSEGEAEWREVKEKEPVKENDEIKTGGGSSVIVKMDDGSMLKIGPLAKMKMDKMQTAGSDSNTNVDVGMGKTWSRVKRQSDSSSFNVSTPTAVAGVRGTFFSSEVERSSNSTFDVFEGAVEVTSSSDGSSAMVGANQRTQCAPNQSVNGVSAIPAEELAQGAGGFSSTEAAAAAFDLRMSVNPAVVKPGENASLKVQAYKDGQPYAAEVILRLSLSGTAKFADSDSNSIETTTDSSGAIELQITSETEEKITISAEMELKVGVNN